MNTKNFPTMIILFFIFLVLKLTRNFPTMIILFFIFLVLKLTGEIDWSWWWVTAPLWGGFIFVFLILVIIEIAEQASSSNRRR